MAQEEGGAGVRLFFDISVLTFYGMCAAVEVLREQVMVGPTQL